jgi:hypothetical protein
MDVPDTTRGQQIRGCTPIFLRSGLFYYIIWIFIDLWADVWIFSSFLGDIGPFFRPDLGGKLGDGYQLQIYINQGFLRP